MNPIAIVKNHPLMTTGVIVGIVLIVVLATSGGNDGSGEAQLIPASQDASAATALQQAQAQSAAQMYAVNAQKEVALAELVTKEHLAGIDAQNQAAAIAAQYGIGQQQLLNEDHANTLEAATQANYFKTQEDINQMQQLTVQKQLQTQADIAAASINAQIKIAKISKPKQGLFSSIFG